MSLIPYKVTAIKRVDTNGVNILSGASVSITVPGGGFASLFDDEAGTIVRSNPFTVDANGEREIWILGGSYNISVAGGQSWDIRLSEGSDILNIPLLSDLGSVTPSYVWQFFNLGGYTAAGKGGGKIYHSAIVANTSTDNGVNTFVRLVNGIYYQYKRPEKGYTHVYDAGAIGDGIVDDSSAYIAAQAAGDLNIDARGVKSLLSSTINLINGAQWLLEGADLYFTGTAATMWKADNVDDWTLNGPFKINGDLVTNPGTGVTSKGIEIIDCGNWRINFPTIDKVKGFGIHMSPGSSTRSRGDGGTVESPVLTDCVWGWHDSPGSGAEYCTVNNIRATGNAEAGIESSAGNTIFNAGHVVDNTKDGIRLNNGSNNAHGCFNNLNINHNGQYNLVVTQVLNGETFSNCHFYGNSAGSATGAIFFDRCKGIHLIGGHLDCEVYNYKDANSGINMIENMYMPGGYGVNKLAGSNNGHEQLIWRNNWGPGVYQIAGGIETAGVPINDPGLFYAIAQRDANTTLSLTSGVSTQLTFSTTPPFPDRRVSFNFATGACTMPAFSTGLYEIKFDLNFSGTAMSVTASYVEMKVNGTSKKVAFASIFSTTKLQIKESFEYNLVAGDVITLFASITGTTPVFGDTVWPSNFSLKRIS